MGPTHRPICPKVPPDHVSFLFDPGLRRDRCCLRHVLPRFRRTDAVARASPAGVGLLGRHADVRLLGVCPRSACGAARRRVAVRACRPAPRPARRPLRRARLDVGLPVRPQHLLGDRCPGPPGHRHRRRHECFQRGDRGTCARLAQEAGRWHRCGLRCRRAGSRRTADWRGRPVHRRRELARVRHPRCGDGHRHPLRRLHRRDGRHPTGRDSLPDATRQPGG